MSRPATYDPANPLIVQSDRTLLLETQSERFAAAREAIAPFAELEKSPEYIHTYRITPLSLCNVVADVHELAGRWGRLRLVVEAGELRLHAEEAALLVELQRRKEIAPLLG